MNEKYKSIPKIQIVVREGILTDVRIPAEMELDIEAIQVDPARADYHQMCEREREIYEDSSMRSADF